LDLYLTAYQELKHDRPVGFGIGSIPWTSIQNWASWNFVNDPDDLAVLVSHIRAMEAAVEEFHENNKDKKKKRKGGKA
jgi:hypothetical protein